jgi:hypothetical protein
MSKERKSPRLQQCMEPMSIPLPFWITNSAIGALYKSSDHANRVSFNRSNIGFSTAC